MLTGVIASGLMLTLLALIIPASLGAFVDDYMNEHGAWGGLVTALLGAGVLVYILSLLKQRFLKRLAVRVSVIGYNRAMSRLLRLPVDFFAHRLAGDLTDRVSSSDRIAKNLADQFLVLIIDMAMSLQCCSSQCLSTMSCSRLLCFCWPFCMDVWPTFSTRFERYEVRR